MSSGKERHLPPIRMFAVRSFVGCVGQYEEAYTVCALGSMFYIASVYHTHTHTHSMGAPVMVELEGETDPLKIAMKELK